MLAVLHFRFQRARQLSQVLYGLLQPGTSFALVVESVHGTSRGPGIGGCKVARGFPRRRQISLQRLQSFGEGHFAGASHQSGECRLDSSGVSKTGYLASTLKSSFHYKRQPAFFVRPFRAGLRLRHDTGATFKFMQCEKHNYAPMRFTLSHRTTVACNRQKPLRRWEK